VFYTLKWQLPAINNTTCIEMIAAMK